jgi:hypothetical protein
MNWSSTSAREVSSPSWVSVLGTFTENRKCVGRSSFASRLPYRESRRNQWHGQTFTLSGQ